MRNTANKNTKVPASATVQSDQPAKSTLSKSESTQPLSQAKQKQLTRITIKYDAGYPNQLYLRGQGGNLSWDKGQPLKNTQSDEWIWETDIPFTQCEFKALLNDHVYENGDNHLLKGGSTILYTPRFC